MTLKGSISEIQAKDYETDGLANKSPKEQQIQQATRPKRRKNKEDPNLNRYHSGKPYQSTHANSFSSMFVQDIFHLVSQTLSISFSSQFNYRFLYLNLSRFFKSIDLEDFYRQSGGKSLMFLLFFPKCLPSFVFLLKKGICFFNLVCLTTLFSLTLFIRN